MRWWMIFRPTRSRKGGVAVGYVDRAAHGSGKRPASLPNKSGIALILYRKFHPVKRNRSFRGRRDDREPRADPAREHFECPRGSATLRDRGERCRQFLVRAGGAVEAIEHASSSRLMPMPESCTDRSPFAPPQPDHAALRVYCGVVSEHARAAAVWWGAATSGSVSIRQSCARSIRRVLVDLLDGSRRALQVELAPAHVAAREEQQLVESFLYCST